MKGYIFMAIILAVYGFYENEESIVQLNSKNFDKLVYGNDKPWIIEFFAPWCGHCKHLAPEYLRAAKNVRGVVNVGAVDCTQNEDLCHRFQIQGYPTMKTRGFGKQTKNLEEYYGERNAASIARWVLNLVPNYSVRVTDRSAAKYIDSESGMAKVLLFTDKKETSNLYKGIAVEFNGRLFIGEVHKSESQLIERFSVKKFPTLMVLPSDGSDPVVFDKKINYDNLKAFLNKFALKVADEGKKNKAKSRAQMEDDEENVVADPNEFTLHRINSQSDFISECIERKGLCAIAILDPYNEPEDAKKQAQLLELIAEKYAHKLHVMYFGQKEQPEFIKLFNLSSGFPAMVLLNPARRTGDINKYVRFVGSFEESSISNFLDSVLMGRKGALPLEKEITFATINPDDFVAPPIIEDDDDDVFIGKKEL